MKQAVRKKSDNDLRTAQLILRAREGGFILLLALAVFLFLALWSYHQTDPGWSHTASDTVIYNTGGRVGAFVSDVLLSLLGCLAYAFPFAVGGGAWWLYREWGVPGWGLFGVVLRSVGFIIMLLTGCGLAALHFSSWFLHYPSGVGGILGDIVSSALHNMFNTFGATLILLALFLASMTWVTGFSWLAILKVSVKQLYRGVVSVRENWFAVLLCIARWWADKRLARRKQRAAQVVLEKKITVIPRNDKVAKPKQLPKITKAKRQRSTPAVPVTVSEGLPSVTLLDESITLEHAVYSPEELGALSRLVEQKLVDFGVKAQVVAAQPGPVITRLELALAPGVKVSKISGLAKDLARSLSMDSVRVVDVIPGKPVVGLELPNEEREIVKLRTLLAHETFLNAASPLSLSIGKDIAGEPIVVDLASMPHLLVAGTTGSGKSVGINAMLLSLLFKATPEQVRMILIDPKMLELAVYDGIPHLLAPVVTDMKEAANALKWCVAEMERRYQLMAALGVRNLAGFNRKIKDADASGTPLFSPFPEHQVEGEEPERLLQLPSIVVVIDEFADMMMVVGKRVESLIARIAQKARAAGIHLILATQRPSVDVITGLIKANIPTRIAFQVASRIDSRTILDQQGAEHLLGRGDMLYLPPGSAIPMRVHGAFVDDDEVHAVVRDCKARGEPDYHEEILTGVVSAGSDASGEERDVEADVLYDEVVAFVIETRRVSVSSVQRRFRIGYNRASRLVEQMEASGVVSSVQSNGMREVLAPAARSGSE